LYHHKQKSQPFPADFLLALALCFNTLSAGFYALAVEYRVLQVWLEAYYGSSHAVRAFNGAAVGFAALCAHSWHKIIEAV